MKQPIKILIVEDEMIIAKNTSLQLTTIGYDVTGILPKGEDALTHINDSKPDIILLDINLKGNISGIETAQIIQQDYKIPNKHFIRVHRSFIVSLSNIDEIAKSSIVISKKAIPISFESKKIASTYSKSITSIISHL